MKTELRIELEKIALIAVSAISFMLTLKFAGFMNPWAPVFVLIPLLSLLMFFLWRRGVEARRTRKSANEN